MKDPTYWLELIYQQLAIISGTGTPADPSEVDVSRYGGTATTLGRKPAATSQPTALSNEDNAFLQDISDQTQVTADGTGEINTTTGGVADAAVSTDASGTISAKLRGLVAILANVWNSSIGALRTIPAPSTTANTPAIVTAAASDAIAANAARKLWSIQNIGTNPLFVRLGTGASITVFHFILKPGTAADDGNGGFMSDEIWKGIVSYAGTSPRLVVTELT